MKKLLAFVMFVCPFLVVAQERNLSVVNTVKPKMGQKMAFEAAYKLHVAKFHSGDKRIQVYEIMVGPHIGKYHLVNGEMSYSDWDKERPDAAAHSMDLDKNFFPYLESTQNGVFRYMDSMSLRREGSPEAFAVTSWQLRKDLDNGAYRREAARSVKVIKAMQGEFWKNLSFAYYEQIWDGSENIFVRIRALKDGFKSLEPNFYPPDPKGAPNFREVYTSMYGYDAWLERTKLLENDDVSNQQYIMRYRKDLSSQ